MQEGRALSQIRGSAGGLVEWSRRDPWRERMGELVEKHIRKACDLNDIDLYDLPDVIGEAAMTAMDCAFEDACTVTWEDGSNLATRLPQAAGLEGDRDQPRLHRGAAQLDHEPLRGQ